MVRVLVVDDSAFMRRTLTGLLSKSPDIEVVGTAINGEDALQKCKELDPDAVTMDIEMPKMDGLTALKHLMRENPLPVLMISSLTHEGAAVTLEALEVGALGYVTKVSSTSLPDMENFGTELVETVKAIARRKALLRLRFRSQQVSANKLAGGRTGGNASPTSTTTRSTLRTQAAGVPPATNRLAGRTSTASGRSFASDSASARGGATSSLRSSVATPLSTAPKELAPATGLRIQPHKGFDLLIIGVSTGGPPAVQKILLELPAKFPVPVLIAQHMPASFTGPFAKRLDSLVPMTVKEADVEERLLPGTVYVCPGGKHFRVQQKKGFLTAFVTEEPKSALYKPSVNVLFETAGETLGRRALGVMLTGMGYDGLEGSKVLKAKGGVLLAQSEASCVVYGMPKAVVDAGLTDGIIDIEDMAATILRFF